MKKLNDLRLEINQIDLQLKNLFLKRLDVAKQIGEFKKDNQLPIFDKERELEIINKANSDLKDSEYKKLYIEFLETIMKLSKEVQK